MKKILKKTYFLSIFICLSSLLFAEKITRENKMLQTDFTKVCYELAKNPLMKGDFFQEKNIAKLNRTLKSQGNFIFSDQGIVWETKKPFPSVMAVGLTSVIQIRADGKKNVTDTSSNQIFTGISKSLNALFSGNADQLLENFSVDFQIEKDSVSEKKDCFKWEINLTPNDKSVAAILSFIQVCGSYDEKRENFSLIEKIIMNESSGDSIKYTFENQTFPQGLSDDEKSYFTF